MLVSLKIKNFAIIHDLCIEFKEGLNILSGETGTGKSIIIQALQMVLGERASQDIIRRGEDFAEVKALFQIDSHELIQQKIEALGLPEGSELLIHRMVHASGRNKIWINGEMATLALLSQLSGLLVDVASQHAHQQLFQEETHLSILDSFGQHEMIRDHFRALFDQYREKLLFLEQLREKHRSVKEREEFLRFQLQEIHGADLKANEIEALLQEKEVVRHAVQLGEVAQEGEDLLTQGEGSIEDRLTEFLKKLTRMASIDISLEATVKLLETALIQVQEGTRHLRTYLGELQFDPERLQWIEDRLALIHQLQRKHGGDFQDIFKKVKEWEIELDSLESFEEDEGKLAQEIDNQGTVLLQSARELTKVRKKAALQLQALVEEELHRLAMDKAQFRVVFRPFSERGCVIHKTWLDCSGAEEAAFEIAPNVGEGFKPLVKIASGGEMSRILLAIKTVLSGTRQCPFSVFDEVDVGIGGRVADVVGRQLATMAKDRQVLCITHLPQIACYGQHHYNISKEMVSGRTETHLILLTPQEREDEIARMLGGVMISEKTKAHAREMLQIGKRI